MFPRDAADLQAENIVQQIDRAKMLEPIELMSCEPLECERAMLEQLGMKCEGGHAIGCEQELGVFTSNENKMSDGGRGRAALGVEMWKSSLM